MNLIDEIRQRCRLAEEYPVQFVKGLKDRHGNPLGGRATAQGGIQMDTGYQDHPISFAHDYLHEVAHVITFREGLFDAPDNEKCPHNRYFALILAVLYRRAECLPSLKLYDFADSLENWNGQGQLPEDELILERFAYIIRRSAELAPLRRSVEEIAQLIYCEDFQPAWLKQCEPSRQVSRWRSWFGMD